MICGETMSLYTSLPSLVCFPMRLALFFFFTSLWCSIGNCHTRIRFAPHSSHLRGKIYSSSSRPGNSIELRQGLIRYRGREAATTDGLDG